MRAIDLTERRLVESFVAHGWQQPTGTDSDVSTAWGRSSPVPVEQLHTVRISLRLVDTEIAVLRDTVAMQAEGGRSLLTAADVRRTLEHKLAEAEGALATLTDTVAEVDGCAVESADQRTHTPEPRRAFGPRSRLS